jgi:tetratricopeptide (TPR) repeat protein
VFASCGTSQPPKQNPQYTQEQLELDNQLLLAQTQNEIGNNQEAERLYNEIITKDSKNALAYSKLSLIHFSQQNWEKAEAYAKKAMELSQSNIWYRLQLAQMYYVKGDFAQSADIYEQLLKTNPDKVELYQTLVDIYHAYGNYNKMLQTLNRMEDRWGVSEEVSMTKFSVYTLLNQKYKAENELSKLAKQYPAETKYSLMLAEMAMKTKDYQKAYTYYKNVENIDADNPYVQVALANYYFDRKNKTLCYEYLMRAAKNNGLDAQTKLNVIISVYGEGIDTNREDFERFFSLLQEIAKVNDSDGRIFALLATGYMRKQEYENAVSVINKAISLGEKDYDLYQNLLFAQSALTSSDSNLDSIISTTDKVLSMYPEQPLPYLFKGVNLMFKGEYAQSLDALQKGKALSFNNNELLVDFCANIAEVYHKQEAYDSSDYYFEKTISLDSTQYMAMNNYAYYLSLRNTKLDRAETLARQVITKFPDNHIYVDTYAWILFLKKHYSEAKQAMDKVLVFKDNWTETELEHYEAILKAINTEQ